MNINPFDLLKNAQKMQEQWKEAQEKLDDLIATGAAGGDLVEIDVNGNMEMIDVRISSQAMETADAEILADLVKIAFNDAMSKIKEKISSEVASMAGLPCLSGLSDLTRFT